MNSSFTEHENLPEEKEEGPREYLLLSEAVDPNNQIGQYISAKSVFHDNGDVVRFNIYLDYPNRPKGLPVRCWALYIAVYKPVEQPRAEIRVYETVEEAFAGRMLHNFPELEDDDPEYMIW